MKIKTVDIEISVARFFDSRQNLIVPSTYAIGHECDLLVVSPSGYATEVEIKTSKSDLKADLKKNHSHDSCFVKYLYFAVPEFLVDAALEFAPIRSGVLSVSEKGYVQVERPAMINKSCRQLSDKQRIDIGRLGCIRIWNLKYSNRELVKKVKELKS